MKLLRRVRHAVTVREFARLCLAYDVPLRMIRSDAYFYRGTLYANVFEKEWHACFHEDPHGETGIRASTIAACWILTSKYFLQGSLRAVHPSLHCPAVAISCRVIGRLCVSLLHSPPSFSSTGLSPFRCRSVRHPQQKARRIMDWFCSPFRSEASGTWCNPDKQSAHKSFGQKARAGQQARRDDGPCCCDATSSRPSRSDATKAGSSMTEYDALVGVGIVFKHTEGGQGLKVVGLVPGGPAHESGLVSTGMLLTEIDGHDITSMLPSEIAPLILGEPQSMWV